MSLTHSGGGEPDITQRIIIDNYAKLGVYADGGGGRGLGLSGTGFSATHARALCIRNSHR